MADKREGAAKLQQHQPKPSRKNGWDEHRIVIFDKPTHLHRGGWPRRRRGEGDLYRRRVGRAHRPRAGGSPPAALTPACAPSLGRPVKAFPLGRILWAIPCRKAIL